MFKEILGNIVIRKKVIPLPETFNVTQGQASKIVDFQKKIDTILGRSLCIKQIDTGSYNACGWECTALTNPVYDTQRSSINYVASTQHAVALLVSGHVSRQMALALKWTFIATLSPRLVVACGNCAQEGGIYI